MHEPTTPVRQMTTLADLIEAIQAIAETDQEVTAVLCQMLRERKIRWLLPRAETTEKA